MRLIDADEFVKTLQRTSADVCADFGDGFAEFGYSRSLIRLLLSESPTIDTVPVVRCKDCARCVTHKGVPICNKWRTFPEVELDGFCSYGERKEGADNEP